MSVDLKDHPVALAVGTRDCNPRETFQQLLIWCDAKSNLDRSCLVVLGIMAGIFIGLGSMFYTALMIDVPPGQGPFRLLGGLAFSMGLLLVCATGAELSTGNCLLAARWAHGGFSGRNVGRVLAVSFLANGVGALALAGLMAASGLLAGGHGRMAMAIADAKLGMPLTQAFVRGIFCNALVCLAVWMILASRTLAGRLLVLALPIAAFVAIGFEHSVANMYLLPVGLMAGAPGGVLVVVAKIAAVTAGNVVGGFAVALGLWAAHGRLDDPVQRADRSVAWHEATVLASAAATAAWHWFRALAAIMARGWRAHQVRGRR